MSYQKTVRNQKRAEAADAGMRAYNEARGQSGELDNDTIRDLIQDMMHWAHQHNGLDEAVEFSFRIAVGSFPREAAGREECGCGSAGHAATCDLRRVR